MDIRLVKTAIWVNSASFCRYYPFAFGISGAIIRLNLITEG